MNEDIKEQQKSSELVDEIKMLEGLASKKLGMDEYQNRKVAFAKRLKTKYPDFEDRRAYHALAGSTIMEERENQAIDDDFPGEDSIVSFLQSLIYS